MPAIKMKVSYIQMKIVGYAAIMSLLLSSCTSTSNQDYRFIEIPEVINKDPQKILSQEELKYDVSQALYALNTAYIGKKHLPRDQFQNLMNEIKSIKGPQSVADFCQKISKSISRVSDNHLYASFDNKECFVTTDRKPSVGKNFYSNSNDIPWFVQLRKKAHKTALLISIVGFPPNSSPVWNGFIDKIKKLLSKSDFIILDMRGNGGGDAAKGFELATLLSGAELKTPLGESYNNSTIESYQIHVNSWDYWIKLKKGSKKDIPAYFFELKKEAVEERDSALRGERPSNKINKYVGHEFAYEKSVKKPIYILIDAGCASSCEGTVDFLEFNPLVKTVGENTGGYVHFANNGLVVLKNSGIVLKMATSYFSYTDNRVIEKIGIKPKLPVPAGQDAMDYSWKHFLRQ